MITNNVELKAKKYNKQCEPGSGKVGRVWKSKSLKPQGNFWKKIWVEKFVSMREKILVKMPTYHNNFDLQRLLFLVLLFCPPLILITSNVTSRMTDQICLIGFDLSVRDGDL